MVDNMIELEGIKTDVRAMPNLSYCSKLRSHAKKSVLAEALSE
jgi:hypothetical protein